ncbi:hypothetical protein chiPu_0011961, partial [Chiloscyllium punctatum]|nr:hypothetical protein [Chiloscyllium punctatum]
MMDSDSILHDKIVEYMNASGRDDLNDAEPPKKLVLGKNTFHQVTIPCDIVTDCQWVISLTQLPWPIVCISCAETKLSNGTPSMIAVKQHTPSSSYEKQKEQCVKYFDQWTETDQVEFVENLISRMCHYQHGHINSYLKPMLQRDFITVLPG